MKKKIFYLSLLFGLLSFLLSLYIFPYYTKGDQIYYINFYENIKDYNLFEGLIFYKLSLGTVEPVYYLLVYFFNFINKSLLFSIINGILGFVLAKLLLIRKFHPFLLFCQLFNFYLLVLFFSAERLKLSLLFFSLALLLNTKKTKSVVLFYVVSILSHSQTLILLITTFFSNYFVNLNNKVSKIKVGKFKKITIFILFILVFFLLKNHILEKIIAYSVNIGIGNILKPILFLILTLLLTNERSIKIITIFLPIIISSFILGGERIVIFSYFIFFYYAMLNKRGFNFGIIISTIYFVIKGVFFLINVIKYNDGFFDVNL